MTFNQWWDTLTPKEHMVLGIHNARFVWESAVEAERERLAKQCERLPFGNTAHSFAAWIKDGGKLECPPCNGDCNQGRTCPARFR